MVILRMRAAIGIIVGLLLGVAQTGCTHQEPASDPIDPYRALPGTWGWDGSDDCAVAPLEIRFSDGGKRMHVSHAPEEESGGPRLPRHDTDYTVTARTVQGLAMAMDGEDRLDASGKLVTWYLFLLDQDQYCWQRSDWRETACTKPVKRCAAVRATPGP